MNHFFRRNQKKLLAIFAAGLMIVFILPSTCGRGGGAGGPENVVVAYAGKDEIHASDLAQARMDWEVLRRIPAQAPRVAMQMGMSPFQPVPYPYQLGVGIAEELDQSPELFVLLQKEADRTGIRVPPDRIDAVLREINLSPNVSAEENQRWRHAVDAFLRVKGLYDRVTSNVKISQPVVARQLAQTAQEVKLNLVEFSAGPTTAPTTAPTTQELQAHFDKYANRPAGLPSTNPASLSFGYQRPDRVKIQYLTIGKEQVREAVRNSKEPYEWEVAARRYYLSNQRDFPVTQPASAPATTRATTQTASPASRPTARPFEEVREQVMERVLEPEVTKLTKQISDAVAERMTADWEKQRPRQPTAATGPATASTTQGASSATTSPASTQPGGFSSFAYLEQVAADIQKQFGVLPAVTSKSDQWLSAEELTNLPGIGLARRAASGQSFANYVLQSAEPFLPVPKTADAAAVLSILEPSQPIEDTAGNSYLFRLTDAQAAHAPAELAEVREQVEADYLAARAFEKTQQEAKEFLESAKKDGLAVAAAAAKRPVIATGTISRGMYGMPPTTIPSYPTTPESRQLLVMQSYLLLSQATPDAPHPVAMVLLPEEKKAVVVELGEVTSRLPTDQVYLTQLGVAHQMAFQEAQNLAAEWFNEEAVKARLQYRSLAEDGKDTKEGTKPPSAS